MPNSWNRLQPRLIFVAGVLLAVVAYWGGLAELVSRWIKQEEYSHGFLIPLISLWLLWLRRDALRGSVGRPSWWSIPIIGLALVMLLLGEMTAIFLFSQLGFLVVLAGLVLALGGSSLLRLTIFPIVLLLFCIPPPHFVNAQLSWRMQLVSSWLGVEFLRLFGYSVFLEGNVIDLGAYKLQVVEACSGLRYLYPLMSVGFLMAYMYQGALRWRILLFLTTIPLTILMNSARISAVGVLVERWGSGMADGFMHYFEGWVIFAICLAFLAGMVWMIEYFGLRRPVMDCLRVPDVAVRVAPGESDDSRSEWPARLAFLLLLFASIIIPVVGAREEIRPERLPLVMFPTQLGLWQQGQEKSLDSNVERGLGLDDYLLRDYVNPDRRWVNFYVAYYASQRKGVSPHSPEVCIPGGGWLITSLGRMPTKLDDGTSFEVVRVVIDRGQQRQLVYYWFEQRGHRIANEYLMKWHLLIDSLFRNRSDGALVRLVTSIGVDESPAQADERLTEKVRLVAPRLEKFAPK